MTTGQEESKITMLGDRVVAAEPLPNAPVATEEQQRLCNLEWLLSHLDDLRHRARSRFTTDLLTRDSEAMFDFGFRAAWMIATQVAFFAASGQLKLADAMVDHSTMVVS